MGLFEAIFGLLTLLGAASVSEAEYVRGCYFTSWAQYREGTGKFTVDNYVPGVCSHLFYAFAVIGEDYKIKNFDWTDDTTYPKLVALRKQQPDLKILVSMGGWTFSEQNVGLLRRMASSKENRDTFIRSVAAFLRQRSLDGLDIDWEYPRAEDKANYAALITELRAYFEQEKKQSGKARLLLTAAVAAGLPTIDEGYEQGKRLADAFDYVNIMSYDYHFGSETETGFNSPLTDRNGDRLSISDTAKHWNENIGVAKSKLLIGMATYGRGFVSAGATVGAAATGETPAEQYTRQPGFAAYYEICEKVDKQGYTRRYDNTQQSAYATGAGRWYGYNDVQSYNAILDWIVKNGYGGAFVWTLDMDDFSGACPSSKGKYPLMNAIKAKLGGGRTLGARTEVADDPPPQTAAPARPRPPIGVNMRPIPTGPIIPETPAPPAPNGFKCTGAGRFVDPTDCKSFYFCPGAGVPPPPKITCATGLAFNQAIENCDWAQNVKCP